MTAVDASVRGPSASSRVDQILPFIGLGMLPPLAFCVLVTGLWASYVLIHTLGMTGAWAVCAAPLVILRLAAKRRPGVVRRINPMKKLKTTLFGTLGLATVQARAADFRVLDNSYPGI
jgi:hypothetical protein